MAKMYVWAGVVACVAATLACRSGYRVVEVSGERIPLTARYDECLDPVAERILAPYKEKVERTMSEVVGRAVRTLRAYRPESPLSNLVSDIIRQTAAERTGMAIDMAVMNMGGIRNLLEEGEVTVGDIFQMCPFENELVVVTLSGDVLLELLEQMAACGGEGVSGASLVISTDRRLLEAKVDGRPVRPDRDYRVATIDYVAEGNDKMTAFKRAKEVHKVPDGLLREVLMEYVRHCTQAGIQLDAHEERRIRTERKEEAIE